MKNEEATRVLQGLPCLHLTELYQTQEAHMFWLYYWLLAFRKRQDDEYVYVDGEAVPRKFFGKEKTK